MKNKIGKIMLNLFLKRRIMNEPNDDFDDNQPKNYKRNDGNFLLEIHQKRKNILFYKCSRLS
jgi:hypothetical protein